MKKFIGLEASEGCDSWANEKGESGGLGEGLVLAVRALGKWG
jgi:hypothetical protein